MATLAQVDPWHYVDTGGEPAFATDWENAGTYSPLAFRFEASNDEVRIYGAILDNGAASSTVTTLPAGYRPDTGRYGIITVSILDSMGAYRGGVAVVADDGTMTVPGTDTADTVIINGSFPRTPPEV